MKTPKIGKLEAVAVVAVMCLAALPTVTALIPMPVNNTRMVQTNSQVLPLPPPRPRITIAVNGEEVNTGVDWEEISAIPGPVGIPDDTVSMIWPSPIEVLNEGNYDIVGLRIYFACQYGVTSHHSQLIGTAYVYHGDGSPDTFDIEANLCWTKWQWGCLSISFGYVDVITDLSGVSQIDVAMNLYEDGIEKWYFDETFFSGTPAGNEEVVIIFNGDVVDLSWEGIDEFPEFDEFGSIPLFSLIIPAGIYRLENPNDPDGPIALYGCQIWIFIRFSLFSGHTAYIDGTVTYHMSSGGDYDQEVHIDVDWDQWRPFCFPIRVYRVICYDSYPFQCLDHIECDLDFYEDGRFIWHYDTIFPRYW